MIDVLAGIYNKFQNNVGQNLLFDIHQAIVNLFSENLKKTANGEVLVESRDQLAQQLSHVKSFAGSWVVETKNIIPSFDDKHCTVRYILSTEKAGKFDIITILSSLDGINIDAIDEVYYQII